MSEKTALRRRRRVADTQAWRARQKRGAAVYPVAGVTGKADDRCRYVFYPGGPGPRCFTSCSALPYLIANLRRVSVAAIFPRRSTAAWRRAGWRLVARAACTDGQSIPRPPPARVPKGTGEQGERRQPAERYSLGVPVPPAGAVELAAVRCSASLTRSSSAASSSAGVGSGFLERRDPGGPLPLEPMPALTGRSRPRRGSPLLARARKA